MALRFGAWVSVPRRRHLQSTHSAAPLPIPPPARFLAEGGGAVASALKDGAPGLILTRRTKRFVMNDHIRSSVITRSPKLRFRGSRREIFFTGIISPSDGRGRGRPSPGE